MGQHIYQALFLNHGSISMRHPAADSVQGHTGLSMAEREGVGLQGCAFLTLRVPGKDWARMVGSGLDSDHQLTHESIFRRDNVRQRIQST